MPRINSEHFIFTGQALNRCNTLGDLEESAAFVTAVRAAATRATRLRRGCLVSRELNLLLQQVGLVRLRGLLFDCGAA